MILLAYTFFQSFSSIKHHRFDYCIVVQGHWSCYHWKALTVSGPLLNLNLLGERTPYICIFFPKLHFQSLILLFLAIFLCGNIRYHKIVIYKFCHIKIIKLYSSIYMMYNLTHNIVARLHGDIFMLKYNLRDQDQDVDLFINTCIGHLLLFGIVPTYHYACT